MQNNSKINNSEILFIYDAKGCNPNGDPDNENKPRIDLKRVNIKKCVKVEKGGVSYHRQILTKKDRRRHHEKEYR